VKKKLRVLVIDGEPLEREGLLHLLNAAPDVEVVGALAGDWNAVDAIRRLSPDVIFLEAQLRACTGFELLSALGPDVFSKVVFTTRERQHAVRAFEIGALDYLIKPIGPERLEMALARSRTGVGLNLDEQAKSPLSRFEGLEGTRPGEGFLERFPVKESGRVYFVRTSAIDWIESDENYIRIHTGGASHLVRRTLVQVETELDPAQFARIHRSTIVNLDRVREIQPGIGRYRLVLLENGTQLRLSERYYRQLVLRGYAYRGPSLSGRGSRRY
jgi:two-component system, LytTR family, response regulator